MEIKIDQQTLPLDGQHVQFRIVDDELEGNNNLWREGYYSAKDEWIHTLSGDYYTIQDQVIEWELLPDKHLE